VIRSGAEKDWAMAEGRSHSYKRSLFSNKRVILEEGVLKVLGSEAAQHPGGVVE
jgi:hypothetical protein